MEQQFLELLFLNASTLLSISSPSLLVFIPFYSYIASSVLIIILWNLDGGEDRAVLMMNYSTIGPINLTKSPPLPDTVMPTSCTHKPSPWLYLKVFYVRLSNCELDQLAPDHFKLNYFPVSADTVFEINGRSGKTGTGLISSTLRRDRVDKNSEEAIFVSTDNVRTCGSMRIEVFASENHLLSGELKLSNRNGCGEKWSIKCRPVMLNGRRLARRDADLPTIEIYVAGLFSGSAVILNKTLHLGVPRGNSMRLALDSSVIKKNEANIVIQQMENEGAAQENVMRFDNMSIWRRSEYLESDDWFNAGVRVGVGVGLGICLGIGLGAGLFSRIYQATTRDFKTLFS